jgi:hypothetical protein
MAHIVTGAYFWGKRRVAFRNDYCTVCERLTLAEGIRSFVMGHIYWIPLLPLGFHRRWFCTLCHHETNERRPTSPLILWLALFTAILVVVVMGGAWFRGSEKGMGPPFAIGLVFLAACIFGLFRSRRDKFSQARKGVVPLPHDACPLCKGLLLPKRIPHCYACKIDIR